MEAESSRTLRAPAALVRNRPFMTRAFAPRAASPLRAGPAPGFFGRQGTSVDHWYGRSFLLVRRPLGERSIPICRLGTFAYRPTDSSHKGLVEANRANWGGKMRLRACVLILGLVSSSLPLATVSAGEMTDLTVSIQGPTNSPVVGSDYTYTITVTNIGPATAMASELSVSRPAGDPTTVTSSDSNDYCGNTYCHFGDLLPGESVSVQATGNRQSHTSFVLTARIYSENDWNSDNNRASVNVSPDATAAGDVQIALSAPTPAPVVGTSFEYVAEVTNHGPNAATGVTMTAPVGDEARFESTNNPYCSFTETHRRTRCLIGRLEVGETRSVTIRLERLLGRGFELFASVSSDFDLNANNNEARAVVGEDPSAASDLRISVTGAATPPEVGAEFELVIEIRNLGPATATHNRLNFDVYGGYATYNTTSLPPGCAAQGSYLECALSDLPNGSMVQTRVTLTRVTNQDFTLCPRIQTGFDSESDNNSYCMTVPRVQAPSAADMAIEVLPPSTNPEIGSTFTYTLKVTNLSSNPASGVRLYDYQNENVSIISADASECSVVSHLRCELGLFAADQTRAVVVTAQRNSGYEFEDFASVDTDIEQDSSNNSISWRLPEDPSSRIDLSTSARVPDYVPPVGSSFEYEFLITNHSSITARSVSFSHNVPEGLTFVDLTPGDGFDCEFEWNRLTCRVQSLAAGASAPLSVVAERQRGAATYIYGSVYSSRNPDPNRNNNEDGGRIDTDYSLGADVSVVLKTPTTAALGSTFDNTITVTNNSEYGATGLIVTDNLPTGLEFASAAAACSYSNSNRSVSCVIGTLPAGDSRAIKLSVVRKATTAISNTVTVLSDLDPVLTNNSSTASLAALAGTAHPLSVGKSGLGTGRVVSSPTGISCGSTCSARYMSAARVTLTATPSSNSKFDGWSGSCSGTSPTCVVTMDAAKKVTAAFVPLASYKLNVSKTGTGTGSVASSPAGIACGTVCSFGYREGAAVTLTAAPRSGSVFAGWSGACAGSSRSCTVTMTAAKSVTAAFTSVSTGGTIYSLSVTKSGTGFGWVSSSPSGISCGSTCQYAFASGTVVTLTVTARSDSRFVGWTGACSGTGLTCSVTMSGAKSVGAQFALR
jgi:uncharacterized repeat protein (TIGR01451 family)